MNIFFTIHTNYPIYLRFLCHSIFRPEGLTKEDAEQFASYRTIVELKKRINPVLQSEYARFTALLPLVIDVLHQIYNPKPAPFSLPASSPEASEPDKLEMLPTAVRYLEQALWNFQKSI